MEKPLDFTSVNSVTDIQATDFHTDYVRVNRPLLIKGGITHWDAIHLWDNAYLDSQIGGHEVDIEISKDQFAGRLFNFRDIKKVSMPFSRFLQRLTLKEGEADYFVGNWLFPALAKDIAEIPIYDAFSIPIKKRMIMARGGNRIALHRDWYQNLLCQIAGHKRIVLIDIADTPFLYPLKEPMNYSPVDVSQVDWKTYPEFCKARLYVADVKPGDVLYIPCLWWHTVSSFERNIMISQSFYDTDEDLLFIVEKMLKLGRLGLAKAQTLMVASAFEQYTTPKDQVKAVRRIASAESLQEIKNLFKHRQLLVGDYSTI